MSEQLRTSWEWERELPLTFRIWDPDGFRKNDGVTRDTPITMQDFMVRAMMCTVMPLPEGELSNGTMYEPDNE